MMSYSTRIAVRLCQLPNGNKLIDGTVIDAASLLDPSFADAGCLGTITWSVLPTEQRCIPEAPYRVEMARGHPEFDFSSITSFDFNPANAYVLDLKQMSKRLLPAWGSMAVGFVVRKAGGIQFYAVNFLGEEIYGSRRQAIMNQPCVFFGPGIFAICATGDASVQDVVSIATPRQDIDFTLLADVGPAFEPAKKPKNWRYDGQSYLGKVDLTPSEALTYRQMADSLARTGTPAPASPLLDAKVHRRKPADISTAIDELDLVRKAAERLDDIRNSPFWSYKIDATTGGSSDTISIAVGPMLQLLARLGPVEALTLGQAVTVPFSADQFPITADQESAYISMQKGRLPFPLVRISGKFYDTEIGAVVEEFAYAGLDLPFAETLFDFAQQMDPRRPQALDEPATADIQIVLSENASALTYFFASGATDDQITLGKDKYPKIYFAETPETDINGSGGRPSLRHGPVDLPFVKPQDQLLRLYPRDIFGRWPAPEDGTCRLMPWPVGAPNLLSTLIDFEDYVTIRIAVQWDRTTRRQADISLGIRLVAAKPNDTTALETLFLPSDGITCPTFPAGNKLALTFDADGNVSVNPSSLSVQLVRSTSEPDKINGSESVKLQLYELIVPLGRPAELMDILTNDADRLFVQIVADASEKVSGSRRTKSPLPRLTKLIDDPRPPVILAEPWQIYWTGLPNGTTGEARALLAFPETGDGPKPVGFHVWRTNETAVIEYTLRWEYADDKLVTRLIDLIRHERDMPTRLALFQSLIEKNLSNADFKQGFTALFRASTTTRIPAGEKGAEIVLPAHQTGFEFVMLTAISAAGVETAKEPLDSLRILAVPDCATIQAPSLRIITSDDTGLFEHSGLCVAIVSHPKQFEAAAVRFFWDAGAISDADELVSALTPISEFTTKQAAAYVSDINDIIKNGVPFAFRRLFLLKPGRTSDRQHFAVDLKSPNGASPLDQIPSPRSQLQSHYLLP